MLGAIANTFANCFKIPELKSRIIFTVLLLGICRIMAWITIPGLDGGSLMRYFDAHAKDIGGSLLGMYSLFTGGAMQHCAVGSLGIMPYITATMIFPQFTGQLVQDMNHLWWYRIQTILILTTGTLLLMWLGEQISERGIGNGVSLVITIGIVADLPGAFQAVYYMFNPPAGAERQFHLFPAAPLLVALLLAVIAGVIAVTQAQRKIPVQYAQRMVGRKVYAGGSSFMPLRVNYAGVMPIIFAQAILMFPSKICYMLGNLKNMKFFDEIGRQLDQGHLVYYLLYSLMILFFSYFWVATQFNEIQIADDLKKHGGYIPGVRPGQATSDYLHRAMSRITLAGAIFLTMIAVTPTLLGQWFNVDPRVTRFFGGTSILITVGVLLDTMRQMESHLLMRHYDGFLKKGRLRGRF